MKQAALKFGLSFLLFALISLVFAQPTGAFRNLGVDSSNASIPLDRVLSGGPPPQGIPALGFSGDWKGVADATVTPEFISQVDADGWLDDIEPVIVMSLNGEHKAYPLQILTWHEIVNDTVGGVPVSVTFCPLCNSALAFDRRVPLNTSEQAAVADFNGDVSFSDLDADFKAAYSLQEGKSADGLMAMEITLGVSGMLYNSNMLMFDTLTSTLWSQLLGVGAVGTLNETQLLRYPAQIIGYGEFKEAFPSGEVLSRDTGYRRQYGVNPYVGYDDVDAPAFLFDGVIDGRLTPKERVITMVGTSEDVAYPFPVLSEARVVNDNFDDNPITLFWKEGAASALDTRSIADAKDVGSVGVFSREVDGQTLDFSWDGSSFVDDQTGSSWNILGRATSGELEGTQLRSLVHDNTLWFSWAAFKPETRIFTE